MLSKTFFLMATFPGSASVPPVNAPWQHQQLLPPPAAKQQPAGQPTVPGKRGLPVQLRDACASTGSRQIFWGQEENEPGLSLPAGAPLPFPLRVEVRWGQ